MYCALEWASIAYLALISVVHGLLSHKGPECISRVVLCSFMKRRIANQLQRLCHETSKGGPCKRIAVSGEVRSLQSRMYIACAHSSASELSTHSPPASRGLSFPL